MNIGSRFTGLQLGGGWARTFPDGWSNSHSHERSRVTVSSGYPLPDDDAFDRGRLSVSFMFISFEFLVSLFDDNVSSFLLALGCARLRVLQQGVCFILVLLFNDDHESSCCAGTIFRTPLSGESV